MTCSRAPLLWLMAALAVVSALAARPAPASAALRLNTARSDLARPALTLPAVDTVQIGPISAAGGFVMYVSEQGCGSADPYFQVTFVEGSAPDTLSHSYSGAAGTCTVTRSPAGVQLRASLAHTININARIGEVGSPLRDPGLPVGCGAPFGPELPATATGRIDVAIHTAVFGRLNENETNAQIFTGAPQRCPAVQSLTGRELTADIGPYIVNGTAPAHGTPQLDIYDAFGDSSSSGLTGALQLEFGGTRAYDVTNANGAAHIVGAAPLTSGSMTFSPLGACPGYRAENGTLAGALTIMDPLLGKLVINGRYAEQAFSGIGGARPGTCNGPGSELVAPAVVSSCDQVNSGCSVAAGSSTATVFDETDPGTQLISSESVNFGDGSPAVGITDDGSVQHAYGQPGVYTVTLTVLDATGRMTTATDQVFIEA